MLFLDKGFPLGELFIAAIQPEVDGKTDRATHLRTGDGIVREGLGVFAMVVVAIDIVEQAPHMLAQGVIEDQEGLSLRATDRLCLLEQRRESPVMDVLLKPRSVREKAGQIGFVRAL